MQPLLLSIEPSDPIWIAFAFVCGLAVKFIGLPPLVGFLAAGFILNTLGAEGGEFLSVAADLGITLLLFTIGLKLKISSLAKPEVWGVASIHMLLITSTLGFLVFILSQFSIPMFTGLDVKTALLIGFALSFSSTVFAVKILDELGATSSRHGTLAIGVLIVQDIAAVVFLAVSTGKVPSLWALLLLLLIPLRPILQKILNFTGHGELLVLYGIMLALGGADLFELVGIKGDVGALIIGMMLAGHPRASEMSRSLMGFKDLFLVGFFLSVGMTALPGWTELWVALLFLAFLPVKVIVFYGLFALFKLRASTSWRTSLNLANYSEFGLIVGALAASTGLLPPQWLVIFALVLSLSFIISAPFVAIRDQIYTTHRDFFIKFQRKERLDEEADMNLEHINVVIFGMGRVGSSVYRSIEKDFEGHIVGVDINPVRSDQLVQQGLNVVDGDATNPDFWTRARSLCTDLNWVLLALPSHNSNLSAVKRLRELGYTGHIAATTKYPDEADELKKHGVKLAFNIYAEAGIGFANDLKRIKLKV